MERLYPKVSCAMAFDLAGSLSAARSVEEALVTYCSVLYYYNIIQRGVCETGRDWQWKKKDCVRKENGLKNQSIIRNNNSPSPPTPSTIQSVRVLGIIITIRRWGNAQRDAFLFLFF